MVLRCVPRALITVVDGHALADYMCRRCNGPFDCLGDDQEHADSGTMRFYRGSSSVGRTDGLGGNVRTHISDAETFTDSLGNTVLSVHSLLEHTECDCNDGP